MHCFGPHSQQVFSRFAKSMGWSLPPIVSTTLEIGMEAAICLSLVTCTTLSGEALFWATPLSPLSGMLLTTAPEHAR